MTWFRMSSQSQLPKERLVAVNPANPLTGEFRVLKTDNLVGSDDSNDLVIHDATVSRRHAKLVRQEGHYELSDLGSTNGTFVNGYRIKTPTRLKTGDEISFGTARFVLANPPVSEPTQLGAVAEWPQKRKKVLSSRAAFELVLLAFAVGFGVAQYLAFLLYHEQNRLILAEAVPLPSQRITKREAAAPPSSTPRGVPTTNGISVPQNLTKIEKPPSAGASTATETSSGAAVEIPTLGRPLRELSPSGGGELAGTMMLARLFPGSGTRAGEEAADFRLQDLTGRWVSLFALRDKVVLLNFWATWCSACRREMPSLVSLYNDLGHRSDFVLLTVSVDRESAAAFNFVRSNGYSFPVLLDTDNRVSSTYEVRGIPANFVIDRKGRIIWDCPGGLDWSNEDLRRALKKLL